MIKTHNEEEKAGLHTYRLKMYDFGDLVSDISRLIE